MARDARLGSVVTFVQELDRSVGFYRDVLGLDVGDRTATAALLVSGDGSELILRSMGSTAGRPLGGVGVQYVVWAVHEKAELDRCEHALKHRLAHRDTRSDEEFTVVEGRDPDDIVVMVAYPGPGQRPGHRLPTRIYGW